MKISKQYIAGFIDGEGYIGLIRRKRKDCKLGYYYKPNVKVTQRTKFASILLELQKKYGGYVTTKEKNVVSNQNSIDCWEIANRPMVKRLLDDIKDFSIVKEEHIKLLLEFIDLPRSNNPSKGTDQFDDKKAEIYSKMRIINKRGLAETNRSGEY